MRKLTKTALILGLMVWVIAPIAGFVWLTHVALIQENLTPTDIVATVESNDLPVNVKVSVKLAWSTMPDLLAPNWTGVVQSVLARPGQEIRSGDKICVVDSVVRYAFHSETPLAASVGLWDESSDVATVKQFLQLLGYSVDVSNSVFDVVTQKAVKEFATDSGIYGSYGLVFDAGWLVYLPSDTYTPASVPIQVSGMAPIAGQVIATGSAKVDNATLVKADTSVDKASEEEEMIAASNERLIVRGQEIPLIEDQSSVASEGLTLLGKIAAIDESIVDALLVRDPRPDEYRVPSSTVISSLTGNLCVVLGDADKTNIPVIVVAGSGGSSIVRGDLSEGQELVVAPRAEYRTCG